MNNFLSLSLYGSSEDTTHMSALVPIGITNWRNERIRFGIKTQDRFSHIYVIGKTGVGKSTLLLNIAAADITEGNGIAVIDPHGDLSLQLLQHIPDTRKQDVVYFNAADENLTLSYNPLYNILPAERHLVISELIIALKKIWSDSWGPRLEYILRFSIQTLLFYPDATLLHIQPLLTHVHFRRKVLSYCTDEHVTSFWLNEFEKYSAALKSEAITPILNKVGVFISHTTLRTILGNSQHSIQLETIMNQKKILLVNLSKGQIGADAASLLGSMIITGIGLAAMRRAKLPQEKRIPFFLFIDEMHSFVTLSFADMLAEARKYHLALFLTHQYIDQLQEEIRTAIFGNVGTIISFRVGATDAEYLEKEFHPPFTKADFVNLPKYHIYIKLMIDGMTSKPFSAITLPSIP